MKKIIPILVIGLFILSGFGAIALNIDVKQITNNEPVKNAFTHTIFAEDGTATWCGYCHYAREALDKIFTSGDYPSYYVCLVDDKNTHAETRVNEYNIYGFPTVWFDGGNKVAVGGGTSNEATYRSLINQCGNRAVEDIDVTLDVTWLGNAAMTIAAAVKNNEATTYDGRIRVYVTEVESSMGWIDTAGHPYTFPFLDYAFNQVISISSGGTWSNSITWDGHNYNDGYGHNFGSIQYGNIMIIAVVFNSEWHQGYSYPPSSYPFDAYWVDDATGFWVGDNSPPNTPSNPSPANGAEGIDINLDLSWACTDPDPTHDTITYDVYFGTNSTPPLIKSDHTEKTYNPGTMEYETTYFWKIVATDNHGATSQGSIWTFTTTDRPNTNPNPPIITGPVKIDTNAVVEFTLNAEDPEQDELSYFLFWGDGTNNGWTDYYESGIDVTVNHSWANKGTYTIMAKVKDDHGAESDWTTLLINVPRTKSVNYYSFLTWLLKQYPNAFPILRNLITI